MDEILFFKIEFNFHVILARWFLVVPPKDIFTHYSYIINWQKVIVNLILNLKTSFSYFLSLKKTHLHNPTISHNNTFPWIN